MSKNIMEDIAKLLGVELNEEFIIENADRKETVVLAADGFHVVQPHDVLGPDHGKLLSKVCQGLYEVKKIPWQPKEGEEYWFYNSFNDMIVWQHWHGSTDDYARKLAGLIYKTEQKACAHVAEDYKRLTGCEYQGKCILEKGCEHEKA